MGLRSLSPEPWTCRSPCEGKPSSIAFQCYLGSSVLISIDLWAKLRLTLPQPPLKTTSTAIPSTGVITAGITPDTTEEDQRLKAFLAEEPPKFDQVRGPTDQVQHHIRLRPGPAIKQKYRPRNPAMQAIIDAEVRTMEEEGVIEPSTSAWSSSVVLVQKKDGSHQFCIDYRKLNAASEKDAYPLPHIDATLDKLRGARYLSTLDLKSGYWQVPLAPESRPVTAFTVPGRGLMQFRVMPFGLHSAPATFQRLMDTVLGPELEPHVLVYLDDIIIASNTFEDHLRHLTESFKYLGHIVDRHGIRTDPDKVSAITGWPTPTTLRKVRQFLGVASWYRRFIADFSAIAAPLTRLTRKRVRWTEVEEAAFVRLKEALTIAPVLACPDFTRPFMLQTDASTHGLGLVLTQQLSEGERVIAYASRTLNAAERNYSATELECLAVIWGIRRMREYLEGYRFTVVTDHQALRWLQRLETPTGRLGRWMFELQQHDFDIRYRKGDLNQVADALSRTPEVNAVARGISCRWYRRVLADVRAQPANYPDYDVRDGHLYRHLLHDLDFRETPAEDQWKRCVPKEQRPDLLRRYHDDPASGHLEVAKTLARIAQGYYWPGMFREISRYVRSCPNCLAHKVSQQRPAGTLHSTPVAAPWQQAALDLIGPLPRSTQGYSWLPTIQDRFSKWMELVPLRRATAENLVRAVTQRLVYRHGCP
ncbi:reverse ribonuclease integrase, partial [Lasius niger]